MTVLLFPAPLLAAVALIALEPVTRRTSLWAAWWWATAAVVTGAATVIAEFLPSASAATIGRCWYGTAIVALSAPVQVLGARRPGSASWTWFVVLPMLAVLGLPIATSLGSGDATFEIELPPLIGYALVLTMGAGNYFGTRFTAPATLFAAGLLVIVVSVSTVAPAWLAQSETARVVGSGLIGLAALLVARRALPSADSGLRPLERLWLDVRDLFGIVWAKRVMDRVNDALETAEADGRLDLDGFVFADGTPSPERRRQTEESAAKTLDWLLKRFVDDEWKHARIDARAAPLVVTDRDEA